MGRGVIITILIVIVLIAISAGVYFFIKSSSQTIETLNVSLKSQLGDESSILERNNKLKEVKIDTTIDFNFALSEILAETATTSCYLYQEMFFSDEQVKFDHTTSDEEKEYLKKMNDFIEGYKITQVIIVVRTINGKEGFDCVLRGNDDTKNTMAITSEDGLRYTLGLDDARKQYLPGSSNSVSDCESLFNPDDKNLCLNNLAEKTLNMDICKFALGLSPEPEEFPYAERFQSCLLFFAGKIIILLFVNYLQIHQENPLNPNVMIVFHLSFAMFLCVIIFLPASQIHKLILQV